MDRYRVYGEIYRHISGECREIWGQNRGWKNNGFFQPVVRDDGFRCRD